MQYATRAKEKNRESGFGREEWLGGHAQDTVQGGVAISDGKFVAIGTSDTLPDGKQVIDAKGLHILPGIIDAHVHFRDPGVTHKEDFATGSTAAICGGVTTVIDMPNQIPPTENAEQVGVKKKIAEVEVACVISAS